MTEIHKIVMIADKFTKTGANIKPEEVQSIINEILEMWNKSESMSLLNVVANMENLVGVSTIIGGGPRIILTADYLNGRVTKNLPYRPLFTDPTSRLDPSWRGSGLLLRGYAIGDITTDYNPENVTASSHPVSLHLWDGKVMRQTLRRMFDEEMKPLYMVKR